MTSFRFTQIIILASLLMGTSASSFAQETAESVSRVFKEGRSSSDARLGKLRNLKDAYHPWIPPTNKNDWIETAEKIRTKLKVSNGLIPAWSKTPLNAVVHGEIHRGDYIVQRVYFESMPGHYVSGNLYRPTKLDGKAPGILSPHGHWTDARFSDMGEEAALKAIDEGGEKYLSGGRHHIQARMVHLARMGCIVFHYDMVGYSDSKVIDHRADFADAEAGSWLINTMGLQTWNSIRALDFLTSLEQVDSDRIAVTGASGGGTQTFMLAALDDRVDVAFPAVMVSTAMQGGCVCENADYLRIGINNVAIAALFAPKPLAMTGANDWTIDIESKGLPELKQVYSLYGQPMNVYAEAHPEFGHNYNYVSREIMYQWMAEHLHLSEASLEETDFWPIPQEELSVFDEQHPLPENSKSAAELKKWMIGELQKNRAEMQQLAQENFAGYQSEMKEILFTLFDQQRFLNRGQGETTYKTETQKIMLEGDIELVKGTFSARTYRFSIPFLSLSPKEAPKTVFWFDEQGKSHLFEEDGGINQDVQRLLDAGYQVISTDAFLTGESKDSKIGYSRPVDEKYSGYTYGYNAPTLVERVRDLNLFMPTSPKEGEVIIVGTGDAGIWTLLAASTDHANINFDRLVVNLDGFTFADIEKTSDPNYLPGAVRYGDIGGFGMLANPQNLLVVGGVAEKSQTAQLLKLGTPGQNGKLRIESKNLSRKQIVDLILKAE
ncbi:MAG: acetylxylan esterase [Planctomycetaceae bacterium]|jgi:hypothetical protein|nr:acetylxylan esterase [Planctomycetaceae bacterium]